MVTLGFPAKLSGCEAEKLAWQVVARAHIGANPAEDRKLARTAPEFQEFLEAYWQRATPRWKTSTVRTHGICFPEGAVAAFLDVLKDGRRLTVGLVGREGFVGWPMLMGDDRWPYEVTIRAEASTALRLEARHLRTAVERSPALQNLLLRYTSTFMAQMGRTIVSNLIHSVERRTARWILLYQDRVSGDQIALTHEELGIMLGVRRASITDALHYLEGEGAIASLRGRVVVRDRATLEALAEETYGYSEAEYQRLFRR